ncbi:MAG: class I SAM-dependent methyltransferase [Acidimicrobiales bacterium]|nr:class I SAM-dependent methyltransferase [Acidimicrobiales bacterium]
MSEQPPEVLTGARRIFSVPSIYRFAQRAIGAEQLRSRLVTDLFQISAGDRILDLGCGPADILPYLPEVEYIGFDHSASYIAAAKSRFGDRGTFVQAGTTDFDIDAVAPCDVAMMIGVLHHLDDRQAVDALQTAAAALGPAGRFVSIDPTFTDGQHPVSRFLASRDRGQHVRTPEETVALVEKAFGRVADFTSHDLLRVPYSHVRIEARNN